MEKDRRESNTQMCNCQARIRIKLAHGSLNFWFIESNGQPHNHEPAESPANFSSNRMEALGQRIDDIMRRWNEGERPGQILSAYRNQPNCPREIYDASQQDLRNLISRYRLTELDGRTELQWLYDQCDTVGNARCETVIVKDKDWCSNHK